MLANQWDNIMRVCVLDDNCRLTVTDLHRGMVVRFTHKVGHGTIERALKELKMHKVCACWVPRELVQEMRERRVVAAQTFLTRYKKKNGTKLLELDS